MATVGIDINHKERVLAAINLEEPDRVPIFSNFTQVFEEQLCKYLGIKDQVTLSKFLDLDCFLLPHEARAIAPGKIIKKKFPDGSFIDEWGIRQKIPGETDFLFLEHPLKNIEDLDNYEFPELPSINYLKENVRKFGEEYAISGGFGWVFFERAWLLRGFSNFMMDMIMHPSFADKLLDKILSYNMAVAESQCELPIDIFQVGDDYGMQDRLMMSPNLWRKFIKPRLKKLFEIPRTKGLPISLHSDGNISDIVPDLIEIGVTILNPIQPLALDPANIKEKYGNKLTLYGTIDIQRTLPFGTTEDVKNEVITRLKTCGYGGGLILAPTHSVLPDVPAENYLTFIKAAKKYGTYPLHL